MADLRPVFLSIFIEEANEGYAEAAREALGIIASLLEEGTDLPPEAKAFLASSFLEISKGEKANKALKLNGRKKLSRKNRDMRIAKTVYWAVNSGSTLEEACKEHGLGYEAVREIYYKYKEALDITYDSSNY